MADVRALESEIAELRARNLALQLKVARSSETDSERCPRCGAPNRWT
jgi:hypothetical protein